MTSTEPRQDEFALRAGGLLMSACIFALAPSPASAGVATLGETAGGAADAALEGMSSLRLSRAAAQGVGVRFEQPEQSTTNEPETRQPPRRLRSWELPALTVVGEPVPTLREEERVGSYGQPRWTATRRFPTTRVYVIPEGKVEVEAWARGTFKNGQSEWRFLQEVEIGLPHRFQLDLYLRQDYDSETDDTLWGGQFEVRWALADWGEIWGNPTLYFEYITLADRPEKIEPKLLLGGEIAPGWHWGANFVAELELGGERENEYQVTTGLSWTVVDSVFSIGVEDIFTFADVKGSRGDFDTSFVIGPSFQWRPTPPMTINVAPLFGVTNDSPDVQLWFNMGWEF